MKQELLKILTSKKIDHKQKILEQTSLKNAMIYCKINKINNSIYGCLIESYISQYYDMKRISSQKCSGDLMKNNKAYEIKSSLGGEINTKFNFVQIRLDHSCDYILLCYHICFENIENLGDLYIFHIDNENMKQLIINFGSYAHGTISKLGKISSKTFLENVEYCLRPKYNDLLWKSLLKFRINDICV